MPDYAYRLEKYAGLKTRHTCPECNKRGQFSRYVSAETGEYLADHVGRCNREDKCGYHFTPRQFFADNPDTRKATTSHRQTSNDVEQKYHSLPYELVQRSMQLEPKSNFHSFLLSRFSPTAVDHVTTQFRLGSSAVKERHTVFWQVDITGTVRSGKVINYDPETGKRGDKVDWVHSMISRKTGKPYVLKQCYFGEHQLAATTDKVVAMVESEKTAIIASIMLPEYVWLATGGVTGCRWMDRGVSSVLLGRKVVLFPDLNMFERWKGYADDLRKQLSIEISVSDLIERACTIAEKEKKEGYDIADFLLKTQKSN
jgi:hypothetical protein